MLSEVKEVIHARGHPNILATHQTTLEITRDSHLSRRGTCIIAVSADKAIDDLKHEFKESLRHDETRIAIVIDAGGVRETVMAFGNSKLTLSHPTDMVVRKSGYICGRTLAVQADKSACDLSRELARKVKDSGQHIIVTLTTKRANKRPQSGRT